MDDPVDRVTRWQRAGGQWRVVDRADGEVTVALLSCDNGDEMGRLSSADPDLITFLAGRETSED